MRQQAIVGNKPVKISEPFKTFKAGTRRRRSGVGLCVLNYMVTSNHIHLLVKDTGSNVIAESMQLIAGRTAQEYNQRKGKQGAFWEDRYHATAIETDEHLHRCLIYMDLQHGPCQRIPLPIPIVQTVHRLREFQTFQRFQTFQSFNGSVGSP